MPTPPSQVGAEGVGYGVVVACSISGGGVGPDQSNEDVERVCMDVACKVIKRMKKL
jgi:hypothetical protein